jgi:L-alanine-DL-glutamate epimerase-like enolase superfamily enzyme
LTTVAQYFDEGCQAIKFHTWCLPDKDLELVNAVAEEFGELDVTCRLEVEGL